MIHKEERISFNDILYIWQKYLWPGRESPIKSHSAMTLNGSISMEIYNYPATHWGIYHNNKIIAVNSGHMSSKNHYRSRGLWVHEQFRKKGLAQLLLSATTLQAKKEGCSVIWSIPRKEALPTYKASGFTEEGNYFATETSTANIYATKLL